MTFAEEWAQIKAHTAAGGGQTRLNGTGGGQGQKKLNVTAAVLRGRAGKAEDVRTQFTKADDEVMRETGEVPGTLKGFATGPALTTFLERWQGQMSYVKEQFTGTAKALRAAADAFDGVDHSLGGKGNGKGSKGQQP